MKLMAILVLLLLAATPAYATTTGLPPIPPSDRVETPVLEASTSANAPGAQAILAPDPVPTNGVFYVNAAPVMVDGQIFTDIAYDVRLTNPATAVAAPDAPMCHAKTVLIFCSNVTKVTVPVGVTYTIVGHTITLGNIPVGASRIVVRVLGAANIYSDVLSYILVADDGRSWSKVTDGIKCTPTAVSWLSFTATPLSLWARVADWVARR